MTATEDAPAAVAPRVLGTRTPWDVCGLSRSGWYRLMSADRAPKPVELPGCRPFWKVSDLERWMDSQKPAR